AEVLVLQWCIQPQPGAVDPLDAPFLGGCALWVGSWMRITGRGRHAGHRDDDPVADAPAADRFGQQDGVVPLLGGGAELGPTPTHRRAMKAHATAAADDGRT